MKRHPPGLASGVARRDGGEMQAQLEMSQEETSRWSVFQ